MSVYADPSRPDTICALTTAPGAGAVAVVRLSGAEAVSIAAKAFLPASRRRSVEGLAANAVIYGSMRDEEGVFDDGLLTLFRAPRSYTGEDVVELSCHGGLLLPARLLRALCSFGARPAEPGEFTRRAFLAGKLDLAQAEAVAELVAARGERAAELARLGLSGALGERLHALREGLAEAAAHVGACIDYPEELLSPADAASVRELAAAGEAELGALLSGCETGERLRQGVRTAIVGSPNVGKSTLMNLLSGRERSLVSAEPGTTRDRIEAELTLEGVQFFLTDTAGIREDAGTVEAMGVALARRTLAEAQLVLLVLDGTRPLLPAERALIQELGEKPALVLLNKEDEPDFAPPALELPANAKPVTISALTGAGRAELVAALLEAAGVARSEASEALIANERQRDCIFRARNALRELLTLSGEGAELDVLAATLDEALAPLLELTGERVTPAVLDTLFSRFCVGK